MWAALSKAEQCALLGAAEAATLLDLLAMWRTGRDFDVVSPAPDVPRMTEAVASLLRSGLIEVYVELVPQSPQEALETVGDNRNWWTDDGPAKHVELAATPAGQAVLASAVDIYSFRDHD